MLFDLKGKRRHVVQGTYLLLAVLMGGGLILFGIGGGTNGGLLDAFKGGGGGSSSNSLVQKRIDTANKQLVVNPANRAALAEIVKVRGRIAEAAAVLRIGEVIGRIDGTFPPVEQAVLHEAAAALGLS